MSFALTPSRPMSGTPTPDPVWAMSDFDQLIGIEFVDIGPDRAISVLDVEQRHYQGYGVVHGGVYCAMIESAASYAASLWATEQGLAGAVGVANSTDFLRSHRSGRVRAVATPIHRGRTQQLWQVTVTREDDGTLVARGQVRLHNLGDFAAIGGTR